MADGCIIKTESNITVVDEKIVPLLKENNWDVTHYEKPDEVHSWVFWDEEIAKFIPWMLGITAKAPAKS